MILQYFLFCLLTLGCYCNDQLPLVKTPLGSIRGYLKTSHEGRKFSAFEGVPFAKPPIGERRFEEPERIEPWHGVWNATFLTECAQTSIMQPDETQGHEDCLHINVYVPRSNPNPAETLDVIVHIHGGGYMYGSGHMYANPGFLMDRDVIFVTFNYRLGIFGFLSTEDDVVPGNNGLKDQTLALKWIQENIASFGGNPNSVTITGLSAGGTSVQLHYLSPNSKNLFHRGFAQSAADLGAVSLQQGALSKARRLADAVGCPISSTRILIDCLKERPQKQLMDQVSLFFGYLIFPIAPFGPAVEKGGSKPFLSADPFHLLKEGRVNDVPMIASMAKHEGHFAIDIFAEDLDNIDKNWEDLAPVLLDFNYTLSRSLWKSTSKRIREFYLGENAQINKDNLMKLVQIFSDRYFLFGAETALRLQAKAVKSSVHYFVFGYPGDNNEQKIVNHCADAKYFFASELTENELKMKDLLLDMLVSFAKTGNAKLGDVEWKPTTYKELTYLSVDGIEPGEIKLVTSEELTPRKFWKSLKFLGDDILFSGKDEL